MSILKPANNPNLWVPCDEYYDPNKIDILCDPNRVPSAAPSISSSPTITHDCSCGVGEFKFELELRTDFYPDETSWQIEDGNEDILHSESGYDWPDDEITIFNYEYCLPVGCYDFVIDDSAGDGICCLSDYYDDDDLDGYYEGSIYGWKEVFHGGNFQFNAIEHFCGEDLCPFATHYPSTSPSISSQPLIINDDYYYYDDCSNVDACPEDQFCNYDFTTSGFCEDCVSNDSCDNIGLPSLGVADCQSICESNSSSEQKNAPTSAPTTASLNIETLTSTVLKYFESIVTFFKNLLPF